MTLTLKKLVSIVDDAVRQGAGPETPVSVALVNNEVPGEGFVIAGRLAEIVRVDLGVDLDAGWRLLLSIDPDGAAAIQDAPMREGGPPVHD